MSMRSIERLAIAQTTSANTNDRPHETRMLVGAISTAKYMDGMFKNCVVEPAEVKANGMEYFDDNEDLKTAEKLISAIEQFLRS